MPARIRDEDRALHYAETADLPMARFIGERYMAIVKRREKAAEKENEQQAQLILKQANQP